MFTLFSATSFGLVSGGGWQLIWDDIAQMSKQRIAKERPLENAQKIFIGSPFL